jgi:RNA polymerase sigma factor (sigma-70 family)
VLEQARKLVAVQTSRQLPDRELVERFLTANDEAAFTALVERHGPMVRGVCYRVLGNSHDADDACQATFLVLARSGPSLRKRTSLGSWLHGTAARIAANLRRAHARRRRREEQAGRPESWSGEKASAWQDALVVLDEELHKLPERYRAPLILCYLEGRARDEAAEQLGLTSGMLHGRLERGRTLLRKGLSRRGLTLSVGLVAAVLGEEAAGAALSPLAVIATTRAALAPAETAVSSQVATLVQEVTRTMFATYAKIATALLFTAALAASAAALGALNPPPSLLAEVGQRNAPDDSTEAEKPSVKDERRPATDCYGDPLPPGALARLGTIRFRHPEVRALAYTPDGKTIAFAGAGGRVLLSDATTGAPRASFTFAAGPHSRVWSLAFSGDGGRLLAAGMDQNRGKVILWDVARRKTIVEAGQKETVRCATLSRNGQTIGIACTDGTLAILDARTGKIVHDLGEKGPGLARFTATFSPDGQFLAGADGKKVRLWKVASGRASVELDTQEDGICCVAFSPDGRRLASVNLGLVVGRKAQVCLWDLSTASRLFTFRSGSTEFLSAAFSPDGKTLAVGSWSGQVHTWDAQTGKEKPTYSSLDGWFTAVAFSPDGKTLAGGSSSGRVVLWDTASGKDRSALGGHNGGLSNLAISADGKAAATAGADGTARLWDLTSGKETIVMKGHSKGVYTVALAPNRRQLVTAGADGSVRLWDTGTGKEVRRLVEPQRGKSSRATYSPSGALVASGHEKHIRLLDPLTGKEVRRLTGHEGYVGSLRFSPDERVLASTGHTYADEKGTYMDGSVRLWDVTTGKQLHRLDEDVFALDYGPDGRTLVFLARGRMHCLDTRTYQTRRGASDTDLTAFAFSPDGSWLATAHQGGIIRVRNSSTDKEVLRFQSPSRGTPVVPAVYGLTWAPDGRALLSTNDDTTALVWDLAPPGWAREGRKKPDKASLQNAWNDLGGRDAVRAYRAIWVLTQGGDRGVKFLGERLRPASAEVGKEVKRLVADLDHDDFARREEAGRRLAELGLTVEPALRTALVSRPSPEVRRRVVALLARIAASGEGEDGDPLRTARALVVLERIGTPQARRLLTALARGAPEVRQTHQADLARHRLVRRLAQSTGR